MLCCLLYSVHIAKSNLFSNFILTTSINLNEIYCIRFAYEPLLLKIPCNSMKKPAQTNFRPTKLRTVLVNFFYF